MPWIIPGVVIFFTEATSKAGSGLGLWRGLRRQSRHEERQHEGLPIHRTSNESRPGSDDDPTRLVWYIMNRALVMIACAAALSGCRAGSAPQQTAEAGIVERSRVSMGSEVHLTAWTADERAATAAFEVVFDEFDRLDGLMSVWKDGSDIERLNRAAGEMPVPVGAEVREVLSMARQASEWSDGKFDVTFGALSGLWKFDHDLDGNIPARPDVLARLPLIDYRKLEVNEQAGGTAFLTVKGMRAHLGGIGKGYAVNRAAASCEGEASRTS